MDILRINLKIVVLKKYNEFPGCTNFKSIEEFVETKKSKNFSNLYSSNQMINQYYGLAPIKISNEKSNRNFNSRTIKSFDFRNLRKNNINYSIHETKHIKKWSNVDRYVY